MLMSVAGNKGKGFTIFELLVVMTIVAVASAGVGLAMRDSSETKLEQEASRLVALLESARAQSRLNGIPVVWRATQERFVFDGLPPKALPEGWLGAGVFAQISMRSATAVAPASLLLGPEPVIGSQEITIRTLDNPAVGYRIFTNGLQPFGLEVVRQP